MITINKIKLKTKSFANESHSMVTKAIIKIEIDGKEKSITKKIESIMNLLNRD